jgi:cytoskeletal protein CcmA (bactofilin family)
MFGRKDTDETAQQTDTAQADNSPASPANLQRSLARRTIAAAGARGNNSSATGKERTLTVGPGLSLSGEIASCDVLVVEGKVEAKLSEGKLLEITESGQFRGNVEIENADIAGRYDGQLIVHGRLTVRATGRISGMVKYGELEVSAGGQIIGEMQITGASQQDQQRGPTFKNAAKFTATTEDEESAKPAEQRKAS